MQNMAEPNICFCDAYPTLQKALCALGISRQSSKRYLTAAQLHQPVAVQQSFALPTDLLHPGAVNPLYQGPSIEVLAEDDFIIALAKPPGVACHPLTYRDQNNCLSFLRQLGKKEVLQVEEKKAERGLLYRLDRLTSGLLLAAKTPAVYNFARHALKHKTYQAMVAGELKRDLTGPHHQYFVPTGERGQKIKVLMASNGQGKWGDLSIKFLAYQAAADVSRIEISLKTGLRHQIRAALAALGMPIVGDPLYGGRPADRLYLHALSYEVQLPGEEGGRTYTCPAPF